MISINGESREVEEVRTIEQLIQKVWPSALPILVEHNGTALHRNEWNARQVNDGDRVEFIEIVAGG